MDIDVDIAPSDPLPTDIPDLHSSHKIHDGFHVKKEHHVVKDGRTVKYSIPPSTYVVPADVMKQHEHQEQDIDTSPVPDYEPSAPVTETMDRGTPHGVFPVIEKTEKKAGTLFKDTFHHFWGNVEELPEEEEEQFEDFEDDPWGELEFEGEEMIVETEDLLEDFVDDVDPFSKPSNYSSTVSKGNKIGQDGIHDVTHQLTDEQVQEVHNRRKKRSAPKDKPNPVRKKPVDPSPKKKKKRGSSKYNKKKDD